ncbi:hypothetical protein [Loigolactobacillus zhaoyuanensis]|uniref:hypothetical protein n=1 Tax=Loigolactobacillus zhaoyuanensis TaxID=2486017 RepID=UPI000F748B2C|nr:hypothetical protein [Loigolactobacillus zhaoyuanensis]
MAVHAKEYDNVLLKDGRVTTIEDAVAESYTGTIGHDPSTWEIIYFTSDDIERVLSQEEFNKLYEKQEHIQH